MLVKRGHFENRATGRVVTCMLRGLYFEAYLWCSLDDAFRVRLAEGTKAGFELYRARRWGTPYIYQCSPRKYPRTCNYIVTKQSDGGCNSRDILTDSRHCLSKQAC